MIRILRGFNSRQILAPDWHPRYRIIRHGDCLFSGATTDFETATTTGPLSLRIMGSSPGTGEYVVALDGRLCRMNDSDFLLINHDQPYAVSMRASQPIESFAVYFSRAMTNEVLASLKTPALDFHPDDDASQATPVLYHGYFSYAGEVRSRVERLRCAIARPDADGELELDRLMRELLATLLRGQGDLSCQADRIRSVRRATRIELSRRVKKARDLLDSEFARQITIEELAAHACLSPFHLQRCFRSFTGFTVQEYQRIKRLHRAADLLQKDDMPVHEVAVAVGYAHHSSFARAYVRYHGKTALESRRESRPDRRGFR